MCFKTADMAAQALEWGGFALGDEWIAVLKTEKKFSVVEKRRTTNDGWRTTEGWTTSDSEASTPASSRPTSAQVFFLRTRFFFSQKTWSWPSSTLSPPSATLQPPLVTLQPPSVTLQTAVGYHPNRRRLPSKSPSVTPTAVGYPLSAIGWSCADVADHRTLPLFFY